MTEQRLAPARASRRVQAWGMLAVHVVLGFVVVLPAAIVLWAVLVTVPELWFSYDGFTTIISRVFDLVGILVVGTIIAGVSLAVTFVIGLPIRLAPPVRRWWIAHGEIAVVGIFLGLILVALSWVFGSTEVFEMNGTAFRQRVPILGLLVGGWLLFVFCVIHVWWPARWRPSRLATARPTP